MGNHLKFTTLQLEDFEMKKFLIGLCIALIPAVANADLVNGDFETGALGGVSSAVHMWSSSTGARTFLDNEGNKVLIGGGQISNFTATSDDFDTAIASQLYQIDFDYGNLLSTAFSGTGTWTAELFAGGVSQGTTSISYTGDGTTVGEIFFGTPNPQSIPHYTGFISTTAIASGALSLSLTNGMPTTNSPGFMGFDNVSVSAVPEPTSLTMIVLGLVGLATRRRLG